MYWCIYLYVIIGGIGKTYAAQDKHSSHGERDNKGIKRVYNPLYSRLRIQTIENVIYLISLGLFMTDMLLEKLLAFPHAVNQILPLIFFIYKKILFLCIVFLDTCCQNLSKKISSSSILIYCSYPKHYQFFFYFGFCKNIVRNKTYQCSKCKLEHYFSRFLTVSYM